MSFRVREVRSSCATNYPASIAGKERDKGRKGELAARGGDVDEAEDPGRCRIRHYKDQIEVALPCFIGKIDAR